MEYLVQKEIDSVGRLVIPKSLRDYYKIAANDVLDLIPTKEGILIRKSNVSDTNFEKVLLPRCISS